MIFTMWRCLTNTTDIRIFVRFALFEHNLCYPTIRLQPCGFAYALLVRPLGVGIHIIGGTYLVTRTYAGTYHHCAENIYRIAAV